MAIWTCYYHVVWTTKYRSPTILPAYEPVIFQAIADKSRELGASILAVNGTADHVHVAVSIPPRLAVSSWAGKVKAASSREINMNFTHDDRFYWQEGYGVMTFGQRALAFVRDYIDKQKQHHASNDLYTVLEQSEE